MLILGLDTCLLSCSVAITDGERVLASAREERWVDVPAAEPAEVLA